jgi:DNA repair protein RadC
MYSLEEKEIIDRALNIIAGKLKLHDVTLQGSRSAGQYAQILYGNLEHELFAVMHLNSQHHLVEVQELFRGTIDDAAIYPREVVKAVLTHNAAAVILIHNHPSGVTEPSGADIAITENLATALSIIDVRVLDHIVVGARGFTSMRERNLF